MMRKLLCVILVLLVVSIYQSVPLSVQTDAGFPIEDCITEEVQPVKEVILSQAVGGVLFSSYIGGNHTDDAWAIAIDSFGFIYVTGITNSTNFPRTHQLGIGGDYDCYVLKLAPNGADIIYATVIGGSSYDSPVDIAVDSMGNVVVVGITESTDFPTMVAFDSSYNGGDSDDYYDLDGGDCFIFKLNALGDSLVYSSYFGGSLFDSPTGVVLDSEGYACIAGGTWSSDFPLKNAYDWLMSGDVDIFVTKFNPHGMMVFSTFVGGSTIHASSAMERASDIDVDSEGNIYVIGTTEADDFPEAYSLHGDPEFTAYRCFIFKLTPDGDEIIYSSLFGKDEIFPPTTVIASPSGEAYIIGDTHDEDFPLVNSMKSEPESSDCYIMRLSQDGRTIELSTLVGGTDGDYAYSAAMDNNSNIVVCGLTLSNDFPVENEIDSTLSSYRDGFVFRINSAGDEIQYSTYIGGEDDDRAVSVAVNKYGYPHVVGYTMSTSFPTHNAFNDTYIGGVDGFLTILATPEDWDGDHLTVTQEAEHGTSSSNPDSDSDSIPDGFEVEFGLDPLSNDAGDDEDSDSLTNLEEVLANSNPFKSDSDDDSIPDSVEVNIHGSLPYLSDSDHDLLDDNVEINEAGTDVMRYDTDFDLMPDGFEYLNSLNPLVNDSSDDFDSDGLTNLEEFFYNADPDSTDGDSDGISDYLEVMVYGTSPSSIDTDMDSLSDYEEIYTYNSDPLSVDGDGDGFRDDWEVANGFDPAEYTTVTGESTTLAIFTLGIAGGMTIPVLVGLEYMNKRKKSLKLRKFRLFIPAAVFIIAILVFGPPNVQGNGDPGINTIETKQSEFKFVVSDTPFDGGTIRVEVSYYMIYFETTHITVVFYNEGTEEGRLSLTIESTSIEQKTEYARGSLELSPGVYNVAVLGRTVTTEITQSRVSGVPNEQTTWNMMKGGFFFIGGLMVIAAVMVMKRTPDVPRTPPTILYYGESSQ
ncbi:MAG: SBBP repeat-containing protein [Candidatus Thorarchaeota archaeon]|jgi:hypothetical protein